MRKTSLITVGLFILHPVILVGQITVTGDDILKPVGYTIIEESTGGGLFSVDLGSTGGPQSWDFTAYSMPIQTTVEVVDGGGTPFGADFPSANLTLEVTDNIEEGTAYQYTRVDPDLWSFLGAGAVTPDTSIALAYDPLGEIPLPITMGSSWDMRFGFSDSSSGTFFSQIEISHITVDAWGTLILPAGIFDVLRYVSYDTSITTIVDPPEELSDTTAQIEYVWISTEQIFAATVSSVEGETNPDFTLASEVRRAASTVGIGDDRGGLPVPRAFRLEQNVPNPFNPQTDITFTVPDGAVEEVELVVFTLRGQRIRTLASGRWPPGRYRFTWDGRDDFGRDLPSGVFLYRLIFGDQALTRKMLMAK
jgi:hypothetical protein